MKKNLLMWDESLFRDPDVLEIDYVPEQSLLFMRCIIYLISAGKRQQKRMAWFSFRKNGLYRMYKSYCLKRLLKKTKKINSLDFSSFVLSSSFPH